MADKMTDKNKEDEKALVLAEKAKDIPAEIILAHPAVHEMATRLEAVQRVLEQLPEVIGRAVASAIRNQPPANASGPAMPVVPFGAAGDVVLAPQKMQVGGKTFELPPQPTLPAHMMAVPTMTCPTTPHKKSKR